LLDELSRQPEYLLPVIPVDLDELPERRLSLLLNNPSAMSDWSVPGLEAVVRALAGDIEDTGFDLVELQVLCDSDDLAGIFADSKDHAKATAEQLEAIKARRAAARSKNQEKDQAEFYTVLVFKNNEKLESFLEAAELPLSQRYHDGQKVAQLIKPGPDPAPR